MFGNEGAECVVSRQFCESEEANKSEWGKILKGNVPSRLLFSKYSALSWGAVWSCAVSSGFFYNTKIKFSWNYKIAVYPKFIYLAYLNITNFHRNVLKYLPIRKMLFCSWANYFICFTFSSNIFSIFSSSCAVMFLFYFP